MISKINTEIIEANNSNFIDVLENNLRSSLKKLSSTNLYGLLIHDVGSLKKVLIRYMK